MWLNRLATRQTFGRCQDSVNPCATMIARSLGPGRWMASIGTPSSVTRVVAWTTGLIIRHPDSQGTGLAHEGADGESYRVAHERRSIMPVLQALTDAIRDGSVEVIDLTSPLSASTPAPTSTPRSTGSPARTGRTWPRSRCRG